MYRACVRVSISSSRFLVPVARFSTSFLYKRFLPFSSKNLAITSSKLLLKFTANDPFISLIDSMNVERLGIDLGSLIL